MNCDRICVRQKCNDSQLTDEFDYPNLILCMSGLLYNFLRYITCISLKFENVQNSNLLCWIEDFLRKPHWNGSFVFAEIQQGKCLNVL